MKTADINNTIIDGYVRLLDNLSPNNKLDLISKLTLSVKSDIAEKEKSFYMIICSAVCAESHAPNALGTSGIEVDLKEEVENWLRFVFRGCLIKELGATKGFLGDANVADWSGTVKKIKKHYPQVKIVILGHGKYGNNELFDYTIELFNSN